jgi:lysylphosphatidylglycerol synthetase-like protein (DUF2156 family)
MSAALRIGGHAARWFAASLAALLAAPSAIGLLYLLRDAHLLSAGTRLAGALPLQQLAGDAAQPLARIAVACVLAGLSAGVVLGLLTRARPLLVGLAGGALAWAVLVGTGAASDAIASALRVADRLGPQLHHGGLWAETIALAAGLLAGSWATRRARTCAAVRTPEGHTPLEHERAAQLVALHGRDTLDAFALREDKAFHFAADGMLAYRVVGRTAIVSGDPIAPPGRAAEVFRSFTELAAVRGWSVVATAISPVGCAALEGDGFRALQTGAEAIVDPATFSLEGRPIRKVRQAVARVERAGWRIATLPADALDAAAIAELAELEERWRACQPRVCGFAMTLGRLWGAPEDDDAVYVLARSPAGRLGAFLRFVPYAGGLSLDATRRGVIEEPNGLGEAMVVDVLQFARERELAEVSLNFAGFAHVMAVDPATLPLHHRLLRWTLQRLHSRFQLERLVRFNVKFFPTWRPRYLLYRRRRDLPLAALRVLQAEAYVRPPVARQLPQRWRPAGRPVGAAAHRPGAAAIGPAHPAADEAAVRAGPAVAPPSSVRQPILVGVRGT